jgi:hypothetical protein
MKTSAFPLHKGPGGISIARRAPRSAKCLSYRKLAPGPWFNSVSQEEYVRRYNEEILGPLDPRTVYDELCALAGDAEPVLLCWEKPPFGGANFCHRRMVADWLGAALGIEVPEK